MTKKVVITGGDGFLGTTTAQYLRSEGIETFSFDRLSGLDILDQKAVVESTKGIDSVIHLAGVLGTSELFDTPHEAVDVNVKGALNVLLACEENGCNFVGITMPDCWDNVYQATKACANSLASAWNRHRGVGVSTVKAYNAFGPGQKYGGGHPQKIGPTFSVKAWRNEPIPVWGDGSQPVDLVYSGDVARMFSEAINFTNDEIFDAGTAYVLTVKEIAEMVIDITGSTAGIEYFPQRPGEHDLPSDYICASGHGWDKIDWKPEFRLEDFEATVLYYKDYVED